MFDSFRLNSQDPSIQIARDQIQMNRDVATISTATDDMVHLQQKENNSDLTRWQQDLTGDLEDLEHDLKREYKVDSKWVQIPGTKPLLNSYGLHPILNLVKVYFNRNLMMSNLTTDIINRIMNGIVRDLVLHLGANYERYNIDFHDLSLIIRLVKDRVEPTLYRCYNNGERAYLNTINKRVEAYSESTNPQAKGFIAQMLGRK